MSLINKIRLLINNERVFIFYNNNTTPKLFSVKKISKKDDQIFVIFRNNQNIKIGIKVK